MGARPEGSLDPGAGQQLYQHLFDHTTARISGSGWSTWCIIVYYRIFTRSWISFVYLYNNARDVAGQYTRQRPAIPIWRK